MGLIKRVGGEVLPNKGSLKGTLGAVVRGAQQAALSAAFPNQFESYNLTLQIIGKGWAESFTFPVLPESLQMAQRYLATVTPTLGGAFVDDYGRAPGPITLTGTFGKKPRTLLSQQANLAGGGVRGAVRSLGSSVASASVSTGFGQVKRLSEMVELSHGRPGEADLPQVLLFNWVFNEAWEVVLSGLDVRMDVTQNGLWVYNLQVTTLRPHSDSMGVVDRLIGGMVAGALSSPAVTKAVAAVGVAKRGADLVRAGVKTVRGGTP